MKQHTRTAPSSAAHRFRSFSRIVAVVTVIVGSLVLLGWISGTEALKTFLPHSTSMKANTAIAFIFLGISLLLLREPQLDRYTGKYVNREDLQFRMAAGKWIVGLPLLIGLITLAEYIFKWNAGIDQLLFHETPGALGTSHPGRMGPNSALIFSFLSSSILFLDRKSSASRRICQVLSFLAGLIAWLAIMGYVFGVSLFYTISTYTQMSLPAALTALLLSLAILAARPTTALMRLLISHQAGGIVLRRLIPVAVLLIPFIGWLRLRAQNAGIYDANTGIALQVTTNVIILVWFIYANAKTLDRTDIARGEAEQKLIESNERFRATFDQADVGIAHVSPEGRWLLVNQKLCDIVGYTQQELSHRTFQDITYPEDLQTDLDYVQKMLDGKINAYSMEKRYIRKDGSLTWINLMVSLIRESNDTPKYFISVVEEINDRKHSEAEILRLNTELERRVEERTLELQRANQELQKSEEKYRAIFEESKDAIFITSNGKFLDINPAGLELFGFSSKEELFKVQTANLFVDAEQLEQLRSIFQEKGFVKDFELLLRRKNGEIITVLETAAKTLNDREDAEVYHGILRDITQLKRLQEHILHTHKLETIGRLAGGVAHDFNNILMAISGYCELISMKSGANSIVADDVQQILKALDRATALTKQLLAFGRKQMLAPKVLNLNSIIVNLQGMIERLTGDRVETSFQLSPDLGRALADPGQIEQVIVNLAVNARDAMPKGGTLTLETGNRDLNDDYRKTHSYVIPGRYVMVAVTDHGDGMDEETKARIFEPFFTTKELGKGTGLGLSTVYGIVKQSGGYIEVFSEKGKGSRFEVFLPRTDEAEEATSSSELIVRENVAGRTVLLVDDNEQVRSAISAILKNSGYFVLSAGSGLDAMSVAKSHSGPIDLMITDIAMPHMDGRELANLINSKRPDMKVLFMSGYTAEEQFEQNFPAEFLPKPASMSVLLEKVRTMLN